MKITHENRAKYDFYLKHPNGYRYWLTDGYTPTAWRLMCVSVMLYDALLSAPAEEAPHASSSDTPPLL